MRTLSERVDRGIGTFSEWLWRWLPTGGVIAVSGNALAGIQTNFHLPLERKSAHQHTVRPGVRDFSDEADLPTVSGAATSCSSPQYCYIHGYPCACCGGSDTACPSGTSRGWYWPYCCSGRTIWFVDCCGGSACPSSCPICQNSTQPNWCNGAGGNKYTCTLAEDHGACGY